VEAAHIETARQERLDGLGDEEQVLETRKDIPDSRRTNDEAANAQEQANVQSPSWRPDDF
jgi:hypothetical protein